VVPVTERFAIWEHVNIQRGVDAYLAAHGRGEAWIGLSGTAVHRPHEDLLSLIAHPMPFRGVRSAPPPTAPSPSGRRRTPRW
jgi:hypothetical protein